MRGGRGPRVSQLRRPKILGCRLPFRDALPETFFQHRAKTPSRPWDAGANTNWPIPAKPAAPRVPFVLSQFPWPSGNNSSGWRPAQKQTTATRTPFPPKERSKPTGAATQNRPVACSAARRLLKWASRSAPSLSTAAGNSSSAHPQRTISVRSRSKSSVANCSARRPHDKLHPPVLSRLAATPAPESSQSVP